MSVVLRREVVITARDSGTHNQARPSAVLGILQDCATMAAQESGLDYPDTMEKYQAAWIVARQCYTLSAPLYCGDIITVETWHRGGKAATLYRDFAIFRKGEQIGEGLALWALVNPTTQKVLRMSTVIELDGSDGGERNKDTTLRKLKSPQNLTSSEDRVFRYSDLDVNHHVNNVKYLDILCDGLHLEHMPSTAFVSAVQIDYYAQCFPGEQVSLQVGEGEGGQYLAGVDSQGQPRFAGLISLSNITEKTP